MAAENTGRGSLLAALREALRFYADRENWRETRQYLSVAVSDGGEKARAALALETSLLSEDHSEICRVPDAAREVWTTDKPSGYTYEDYLRDKERRV